MSDMKQVKVDNWGIYFLQRLKHFFNRTDYCDLTLQFQDNAQLKVHRLVLNACTEYFELLERTCEMYEDCLIMPDDLQAEVVVPIVNFMYTGQLEFEMELLEKLFQTSQIMNIPVLSKLLDAQRHPSKPKQVAQSYHPKQSYSRNIKRPYNKAFDTGVSQLPEQKIHGVTYIPPPKKAIQIPTTVRKPEKRKVVSPPTILVPRPQRKHGTYMTKAELANPRPTRYEVPEELDNDNIFEPSFMNISYESKPLMIHPETSKRHAGKHPGFGLFNEASSSNKTLARNTSFEVECRKISNNDSSFDESITDDSNYYKKMDEVIVKSDPSLLFDQVMDNPTGPKMIIETKDSKQASNIDHAKIISEVLKKYPHLVNSNKNIKLKILDNPQTKPKKSLPRKKESVSQRFHWTHSEPVEKMRVKEEQLDNTYEEVLNSKEAARLIALGADNIKGPWICLICGTPGKALHFPTYFKFRRHLVEIHNEKLILNMCEYCGLKSGKRNYLLHHLYTKHNVPPPPSYHFPKCNQCNYIALTEGFLIKHKASHAEQRDYRCNVCFVGFKTSALLLRHIQATGHKFTAERKANLQCVYCQRVFLRETNLYTHLKTSHKVEAKKDGIVEDSDEEEHVANIKYETPSIYEPPPVPLFEPEENVNEMQYQIQSSSDGNIHIMRNPGPPKPKILNTGLKHTVKAGQGLPVHDNITEEDLSPQNTNLNEEMMITEQEYVNSLVQDSDQYYMPSAEQEEPEQSMSVANETSILRRSKTQKKSLNPLQIAMTNQEQMATSNHPVIFDSEGNPGKTLAVLTTLEHGQSDELMILPDDEYTINVPQGEDASNQNIVVVYSHPMDSSKPFIIDPQYAQSQIISTQNSQFVQTPAIITPSYIATSTSEIITQASPTVHQEIAEQHIENEQATIEQNILPESHIEQAITTQTDDSTRLVNAVEIPENELIEDRDTNETNATIDGTESDEQSIIPAESQTFTQVDMEVHIEEDEQVVSNQVVQQDEVVEEQTFGTEITTDKQNEVEEFIESQPGVSVQEQYIVQENVSGPEQEVSFDVNENNKEKDLEIEEPSGTMEIVEEITENEPLQENITEVSQPATMIEMPVESKEQIQSLASEWSEDEEEIPTVEKDPSEAVAHPVEVEESIENIQQEMEKGVSGVDTEEETELEQEELPQEFQELPEVSVGLQTASNGTSVAPDEKISSLLNDWDENDSQESQEEDVANNGSEAPVENNAPEGNIEEVSEVTEPEDIGKAPLKVVKSLVSDWDEEEEEAKE